MLPGEKAAERFGTGFEIFEGDAVFWRDGEADIGHAFEEAIFAERAAGAGEGAAEGDALVAEGEEVAEDLIDTGLLVDDDAVKGGLHGDVEEKHDGDAGLAEGIEGGRKFAAGIVAEDDAAQALGGELVELGFAEVVAVAVTTEEELVAALEGGVFDDFGDFDVEAIGDVGESEGDDAGGGGGIFGFDEAVADAGERLEDAGIGEGLESAAESGAGDSKLGGEFALGGEIAVGETALFDVAGDAGGHLFPFDTGTH